MKMKTSKLYSLLLFFVLVMAGCDWMYNSPVLYNVDIYKTKGDYRHLYTINMSGDEISAINCWTRDRTLWSGLNQDTICDRRQYGANGYVLSETNRLTDIYLSFTFKETVLKEIAMNNPGHSLPEDTLLKYILDNDPYLEFWRCTTTLQLSDSVKINEIIRNGEIEKYFERLK
jgi:hypothetical protein